jgi:single-strand DNA-binding protein
MNETNDILTLTGFVATNPKHTASGTAPYTSFRLASNQRRFDREKNTWVETGTNWYTIKTFRELAVNVAASVSKGDPVVVTGRVRIRDWESGERSGTNVDVEAESVGHNLSWGRASFSRVVNSSAAREQERAADDPDSGSSWAVTAPGASDGNATPDFEGPTPETPAESVVAPSAAAEPPGEFVVPF